MLVRDPKRRATAQQILQHEWMRENGCASDQPIQIEVLSRIKQFSAMNRLKKEALKVSAQPARRRVPQATGSGRVLACTRRRACKHACVILYMHSTATCV